jgi:hypothetical protein
MKCPSKLLLIACAILGQINTMANLRGLNPPCEWSSGTLNEAIRYGQLETLKWMKEHGAASIGNLAMLK